MSLKSNPNCQIYNKPMLALVVGPNNFPKVLGINKFVKNYHVKDLALHEIIILYRLKIDSWVLFYQQRLIKQAWGSGHG